MSALLVCKCDHTAEGAIPLFLCRMGCNPEPDRSAVTANAAPAWVDPIEVQQKALRAKFKADDKAKAHARIAKMKATMGTDDPDADIGL